MACAPLHTGAQFLSTSLTQLDCQARTIGAYGYGALADPGSSVSIAMGGMLTIFVAIFGIRMMLNGHVAGRDLIGAVLRVGIVLTLATSWPAWRVVGYDLIFDGPAEVARPIIRASSLPSDGPDPGSEQQKVDNAIIALTQLSNRAPTGATGDQTTGAYGDPTDGIALTEKTGLAWGRIMFLTGAITPFALTRLGAGLLLAVAPIMAAFLLFGQTVGLFMGWLRGLAFTALGSLAYSVVMGVELALIEPWLSEAVGLRAAGNLTPSAPTELIVLATVCGVLQLGLLVLIARVVFQPAIVMRWIAAHAPPRTDAPVRLDTPAPAPAMRPFTQPMPTQARLVADAVAMNLRRENGEGPASLAHPGASASRASSQAPVARPHDGTGLAVPETLGTSFRRTSSRSSAASTRRDTAT